MHSYTSPAVKTQADEDKGLGMFKSNAAGATYVANKINRNETVFPSGGIVVDDTWGNNAIYGANKSFFAWKTTSGKGLTAFGQMISESKQFPICMAKRVYETVCKRETTSIDMPMINSAATEFSTKRNYNLKFLFQKIVTSKECLGGN
jgi:phosphohistidine swiveling domain-containing protein